MSARPREGAVSTGFERVAHRGSPRERLENTLPSFLLALEHGADAVELDAHVTSDGVVVVHHDDAVQRRAIARTSWRELSEIDLGSGARIPRLKGVLDAIGDRATVYIELKGVHIEDAVIAVARKHGRRFALHSFDHDAIARVAKSAPDISRGVLFDKDTKQVVNALRTAVDRVHPRDVWPHWTLVNRDLMETADRLGVRVVTWTVNSARRARTVASMGVSGICSDDVRLLANL